jgi:hypothetical protein
VKKIIFYGSFGVLLGGFSTVVGAQLVAVDDSYGVPVAQPLVVETPGVLDNDSYNGEPAEDGGAVAELRVGPVFGNLVCESNAGIKLCPDGSFTYTPGVDFPGSDTFTYRATVGEEQAEATVTLSACDGGPTVFVCWKEAEFLVKLSELGFGVFREGFEDDQAWALARSPFTAPSVVSQGIKWESNHPAPPAENEITTGPGPARSGEWGVFDPSHGFATGTAQLCDVDNPPEHCLSKDGFTGIRKPGENMLYAAGGYFTGSAFPKLVMILDGGEPIALGSAPNGFQFYGVINTLGFESFRIEETDGKIGQARFVYAADFTFGTSLSIIFADGFESW